MYFLIRYLIRRWRERRARHATADEGPPGAGGPEGSAVAQAAISRRRARTRSSADRPPAAARGPLALLAHQVRYDLLASVRNPRARFFTFLFPILLLVVFTGVFGHGHTVVDGAHVEMSRFYVPGILAMSIVVATYAGLVISISTLRETGVLKRRRGTPGPPALLIAGQALTTVVITAAMSAILLVIAKLFYGVGIAPAAIAAIACVVPVATIAFACIAYAVSGLIGNPDAAQPIVQATTFPLWFISGVFIPDPNLSHGLRQLGEVFPVAHLANTLHLASVNGSFTGAISVTDVLVLVAWALAAAAFAAWRFSWLPSNAAA